MLLKKSFYCFFALINCLLFLAPMSAQQYQFEEKPVLFQEPLSPRIANYDINVRLESSKRLLHGREILTWKNTSNDDIKELQFHLYLNGFRNSKSTFMIESGRVRAGSGIDEERWGFIQINKMKLLPPNREAANIDYLGLTNPEKLPEIPGQDLTPVMEYIQPDIPEHTEDKTVLKAPLPQLLKPGESVSIYIEFTAKLPQPPTARTGAKEEYFFVAQWFPKIGVYTEEGWNCHQFHVNSEFFADFGVYNVWITVPRDNIVGATGMAVGEPLIINDSLATHYYHAEDVHDFAWTTSPEFLEFKGKSQDVDIRVLMQPDHAVQGPRLVEAAKVAVEYFQNWYGDYPFPNLTVVDPRRGASQSGGMEYPTLISALTVYGMPQGLRIPELTIIHEFGHNYWYHLLASNEFEESWLDEGINTYTEIQIMNDKYGPQGDAIDLLGVKINDQTIQRRRYLFYADVDPMLKTAWEYYSRSSYGVNSYAKPGIVLTSLHNYLGEKVMRSIIRTYAERWRFKHPKSQDFVDVANEVSGQNLKWFFDQVLYTNAVLDYSVDVAFSRLYDPGQGIDFNVDVQEFSRQSASDEKSGGDSLVEIDSVSTVEKPQMYYSGVNIRRLGSFKAPVVIELVFENNEIVRKTWDGQELWKKYRFVKPTRLLSATIDPDGQWVMDVNFINNSYLIKKRTIGINKLALRWMFAAQFSIDQPEFWNLFSFLFDLGR